MNSRSRFGIALSVAALALGTAACGGSSDDKGSDSASSGKANPKEGVTADTINYGLIYDASGPQTAAQTPWAEGFRTVVNKTNDAGGVNGRKIELKIIDDQGVVPPAVAGYKRLVTQTPVLGITGINASSAQEAAIPMIRRDNMPFVGPQSNVKSGVVPFAPSIFYVLPTYADQADVLVGYMNEKVKKDKPRVAIFRLVASSGEEVAGLVKQRVKAAGGEIVSDQQIEITATSADAQVQKIIKAKPDYVVVHSAPTHAVAYLKAMQKFGTTIPTISTFAAAGPLPYGAVNAKTGNSFEFTSMVTPSDIQTDGGDTMLADAKKYGYEKNASQSSFAIGYVAGLAVTEGLKNAGDSPTRASFIKGMEQISDLDTGGLSPNLKYSDTQHTGLTETRPYKYNYDTKKFEAIGEFSDYAKFITNQYMKEGGSGK